MAARPGPLRVAVVGAGLMGRWHSSAIQRVGNRVVAIVDADPARASALAARLEGRPAATASLGELLNGAEVDVVHICTPVESHVSLAMEAMGAGCHVLMEKPLAAGSAETASLLAEAARRGILLCPVHQFLFQNGVLDAGRWLSSLGALLDVELVACSAGAAGRDDAQREQVALDILPHALALAGRLTAESLAAASWHVGDTPAGELRLATRAGSTSVSITVSMSARPTENSMTLRCSGGTIRADLFHGFAVREQGTPSRADKLVRPFRSSVGYLSSASSNLVRRAAAGEAAYPGLRELVRRFHLAARGTAAAPISPSESLDVALARDSVARARQQRKPGRATPH